MFSFSFLLSSPRLSIEHIYFAFDALQMLKCVEKQFNKKKYIGLSSNEEKYIYILKAENSTEWRRYFISSFQSIFSVFIFSFPFSFTLFNRLLFSHFIQNAIRFSDTIDFQLAQNWDTQASGINAKKTKNEKKGIEKEK